MILDSHYVGYPPYGFAPTSSVSVVGMIATLAGAGSLTATLTAAISIQATLAGVGSLTATLTANQPGRPSASVTGYPITYARLYAGPIPIAYITSITRYDSETNVNNALVEQQFDPGVQGDPGADVDLP